MATLPWGWGGLAVGVLAPKLYVTDSFEATQVSTPNGGASASSAAGRRDVASDLFRLVANFLAVLDKVIGGLVDGHVLVRIAGLGGLGFLRGCAETNAPGHDQPQENGAKLQQVGQNALPPRWLPVQCMTAFS
jgi:hypothetical protein